MSQVLATVGMALLVGAALFVVGAYVIPPLVLAGMAWLARQFIG